jgi:hypothetical protein
VCGSTLDLVDAAIAPHTSTIAAAIKALPAAARGDAEFYVDVTRSPVAADLLAPAHDELGTIASLGVAVRVDPDGATLHVWARGAMTGALASMLRARPPAPELAALTGTAATVLRFTLDRALAARIGLPSGALDDLTGDVEVVSAGHGPIGAALLAQVATGARAADVAARWCGLLDAGRPWGLGAVHAAPTGCTADLALGGALEAELGFALPATRLAVAARGGVVAVTVGELALAELDGNAVDQAASAEARAALTEPVTGAVWSRGLDIDPIALPAAMGDAAAGTPRGAVLYPALIWALTKLDELVLAVQVSPDAAAITLRLTTFGGDPPAARAAYQAALHARLTGDQAGYTSGLAAIAHQFASSRTARRAQIDQASPVLGPFLALATSAVIVIGRDRPAAEPAPGDDDALPPLLEIDQRPPPPSDQDALPPLRDIERRTPPPDANDALPPLLEIDRRTPPPDADDALPPLLEIDRRTLPP